MNDLFYAHSGLRFLVFLAALIAIAVCLIGLVQKKPFTKLARIVCSAFAGLLHTQVLLGLIMVAMGRWYPYLIRHMVMMIAAAVLSQVMISRNKRQATPGYVMPLIGIGGALLLIIGGIYAIGRTPLFTSMGQHVG